MKAKKLIEVAMPIKEISAESVRDKSIRHGHISTLHLWWARRPLPTCRAVVFASVVPDPLDENCPKAFKDAVYDLLCTNFAMMVYQPYKDIPYTAAADSMDDNLRNRLLMFIGKFSDSCQSNMIAGKATNPKDQLQQGCLIKWESKNDPEVLGIARKLIWVAYNSERFPNQTYKQLATEFDKANKAIKTAEDELYETVDRHIDSPEVKALEAQLHSAIEYFQDNMPSVFDPFAGGGAIPLEAARLGCRSFGNDINPVAHMIEKGSVELPQKYGKPITYTNEEFDRIYGEKGRGLLKDKEILQYDNDHVIIPNRLSFDVEYYAREVLSVAKSKVGKYYPKDTKGNTPVAYYWARTAVCSNPTCRATIPLLKQFYLANTNNKVYLKPKISGNTIDFEICKGTYRDIPGWNNRGNVQCPCCGSVTSVDDVKEQSNRTKLSPRLLACISEDPKGGKYYSLPQAEARKIIEGEIQEEINRPTESMQRNSNGGDTFPWGFTKWGDLYTDRQLRTLYTFVDAIQQIKLPFSIEYSNVIRTYLGLWFDRIALVNTSFGRLNVRRETLEHPFNRQAIAMIFDYPESNPFCTSSGSALNQLDWVTRYIESESDSPFSAIFYNASSGEISQFDKKSLCATVTDPPYYDAIAYADISDLFYIWLKRTIGDIYPINFSTPQTPKTEECTALKHHHEGDENAAKRHFENKLLQIFEAIEEQTDGVVSIMFAHQSTEAWTTLCDSILGANMNIEGSWAMDTEMQARSVNLSGDALESSVTVACEPAHREGNANYREVRKAIQKKVAEEVQSLYGLGFRGADLLTACFGKAVSEFGNYNSVEKADGSRVSVAELLELARTSAFTALLRDFEGDDYTKFYIGWLQLNGMGDTDYDDATKFTRVGMNVNIGDIFANDLLIKDESVHKQHLASYKERKIDGLRDVGDDRPLIDKVHRTMWLWASGERWALLNYIARYGQDINNEFWRVFVVLKELLPISSDDYKQVAGLLQNAEELIRSSKEAPKPAQEASLFDGLE